VTDLTAERRRRITHRTLPVFVGLAVVALIAGAIVGASGESAEERTARDFGRAWERGDYSAMHELLAPRARSRFDERALRRAYRNAAATATASAVRVGDPRGTRDGGVRLPVEMPTRVFGTIRGEVLVPVSGEAVAWRPHLVFPGLEPGGALRRGTVTPERGRILSRNRKTLAEGPARSRTSPLGPLAGTIAGRLQTEETRAERDVLYARGFPRDWPVGQTGLERAFERDLAGRPGGELILNGRVIARARPRAGRPVRTTIDTRLQDAAGAALAGRFGGVAAMDTRTGEVRALAGIAISAPQPPGSTFKIVTTTAALEAGRVKLGDEFPVETRAVIDGVDLENANGESCGGTFRNSFAHSCNSVFAPLGVRLGARRLVDAAERYGFNAPPAIPGELPGTLPPAAEIRTPLEVGSTAIGQGKVLATPLTLASIAQTVAAGGVRVQPTLRAGERGARTRVTTRRVARTLRALMVDVVAYGTGTAAALPNVRVAGKTGTAELGDTRGPNASVQQDQASNTDAWFTAFAPAERPRLAVAVMLVRAGAGGATAAPAARAVLDTAF
jgi:peptidoglycan glycosyltransferase